MERVQTLKESYEYALPPEDIDGIKKVATSGMKKLLVVFSALFLGLFILLILLDSYAIAFSALTAGIISLLLLSTSIRNTNRGFDKTKGIRDELTYKLRIYDDFMVLEKSGEAGLLMLSTSSVYDASSLGENDKYIVVSNGVYLIPVPKDMLSENSFFRYLHSLKGAKIKRHEDAPKVFVEPREEAHGEQPREASDCEESYAIASPIAPEQSAGTNTPPTDYDAAEGADSFKSGSFEAYEASKTNSSSSPYAYEGVMDYDKNKSVKTLGIITFALALASIFISIVVTVIATLSETSPTVPLLLVSLLPVSSLITGVILFRKQEKCLKNIFAGILALVVIISIDPSDVTVYDDGTAAQGQAYADSVEAELQIDIPELSEIYYYTSDADNTVELSADLDSENFTAFIEYTKTDERFIFNVPNLYMGVLPEYFRDNDSTVSLIYNKTTNEYNTIPKDAGTYRMIYVAVYEYDGSSPYFRIFEYDLEYVTDFN